MAALVVASLGISGGVAAAAPTTYTKQVTIPVPPASNYAGGGGGDGWAVALTPSSVYNVFHHNSLTVACHRQSDASACHGPKTLTDANGVGFYAANHPGLTIDQAGRLLVYATRNSDATGGVVCFDTTQPANNPNPFCGFTTLTGVGEASPSVMGNGVVVGSKFYAFNYASGGAGGSRNKMLCYDLATSAACAGQPYSLSLPAGPAPSTPFASVVVPIAGRVVVPVSVNGAESLACFDPATTSNCVGSWPVPLTFDYSYTGGVFPLMSGSGTVTGMCVPNGSAPCFSLVGASVATPANLATAIGNTTGYNGPPLTIGARVYVPSGVSDRVHCYDYSAGNACANFPHALPNLGFLYTVNPDPQRPECIWVNADHGSAQIQNFDAFSGGACGQGPVRVLASSFVPPEIECTPLSYTRLAVLDPQRNAYANGSVAFRDGSGNPIANEADAALDNTGGVDLTGRNLTSNGYPQFLITLNGLSGPPSSVTVELTWTGENLPECGGDTMRPGGAFALEGGGALTVPRTPHAVCPPGATLTQARSDLILGVVQGISASCGADDAGTTVATSSITSARMFGGLLRIDGMTSRCTSGGGTSTASSTVGSINGRPIGAASGSLSIPGVGQVYFNETARGPNDTIVQNAVRIARPPTLGLLAQQVVLAGCYFT